MLTVLITKPAYAYLDPGTGSILLQALIGGVAACALFGRSILKKWTTFFENLRSKNSDKQ